MNLDPDVSRRPPAAPHLPRGWYDAAGGVLVALGVTAVALPLLFTIAFDYAIGALVAGGGVVYAIHAFQARRSRSPVPHLVLSALYVVAGVLLLTHPVTGVLTLTLTLSALLLAAGASRLIVAYHLHPSAGWAWTLASGVLAVLLGGILLVGWPSAARWAVGIYVGVDLILAGWSFIRLEPPTRTPVEP